MGERYDQEWEDGWRKALRRTRPERFHDPAQCDRCGIHAGDRGLYYLGESYGPGIRRQAVCRTCWVKAGHSDESALDPETAA